MGWHSFFFYLNIYIYLGKKISFLYNIYSSIEMGSILSPSLGKIYRIVQVLIPCPSEDFFPLIIIINRHSSIKTVPIPTGWVLRLAILLFGEGLSYIDFTDWLSVDNLITVLPSFYSCWAARVSYQWPFKFFAFIPELNWGKQKIQWLLSIFWF